MDRLKGEYSNVDSDKEREEVADKMVFILVALLVTIRGGEIVKMVIGQTREYFVLTNNNAEYNHVVLPLRGGI